MESVPYEPIRLAATATAERHGAHLVDLIVRGHRGKRVLEVYIDAEAGVGVDLCTAVSRALLNEIETAGLLEGGYRLEVSSPGIGRPLQFPWQYRKHLGRPIRVRRNAAAGGDIQGTLADVNETGITVTLRAATERVTIPFADMVESTIQPPW